MLNKDIKKTKLAPKKTLIFFIAVFGLIILAIILLLLNKPEPKNNFITINGNKIYIEKLISEKSKEKGLSGRKFLPANEGLLFIYESLGNWKIWMKDMLFSIDIIWINDQGTVVSVKKNVSPDTFPEIFEAGSQSKYILEVNSGLAEKYNIKIGDKVYNLF